MSLYYISMVMIILSNILYHLSSKSIPAKVNPIVPLIATYSTALFLSLAILFVFPSNEGRFQSFKEVNWASYTLGFSIVALEMGFLLAYRSGWNVSLAALVAQVVVSLLLIPIGIFFFREHLSLKNVVGIVLSIIGIIFISQK